MGELTAFAFGAGYVALGVAVLVIARLVRDFVTPYRLADELTGKDNPALGLALSGYLLASLIIYLGAAMGPAPEEATPTADLLLEMAVTLGYALGGIVLLNVGASVVDRFVLVGFSVKKELVSDRNMGTGAVMAGCYVATGLVVAGSLFGQGLGPFGVGAWHGPAAGAAFGLTVVAAGVVLTRATGRDLGSVAADLIASGDPSVLVNEAGQAVVPLGPVWGAALLDFAYYGAAALVVLGLLRPVTDALLLPGTTIAKEIGEDKNLAAAFVEGAAALGVAGLVFFML